MSFINRLFLALFVPLIVLLLLGSFVAERAISIHLRDQYVS
ncbi:hypothetical protein WDW37_21305 [Bdellovibrionota bacterium FG-1]